MGILPEYVFSGCPAPEILFKLSGMKSSSWADSLQLFFNGHTPAVTGLWQVTVAYINLRTGPCDKPILCSESKFQMLYWPLQKSSEVFSFSSILLLLCITLWHPHTSRPVNINAGRKYWIQKLNQRALKAYIITYCSNGSRRVGCCW